MTAYPIFLNTQSADTVRSADGYFEWILDQSLTPVNKTISDMEIQVLSLQISRQFENTSNGGNILQYALSSAPTVFFTVTFPERYYSTIDEIITAFNSVTNAERITGAYLAVPRHFSLHNPNRTDRLIGAFSALATEFIIHPKGLGLRIGVSNETETILATNIAAGSAAIFKGTFDLNFPKMVHITSEDIEIDQSADSTPTASKKILCGSPCNAAYGDFLPMAEPFVRLPISNKSINKITLKLVDELFQPIQMYNAFSITLMLWK